MMSGLDWNYLKAPENQEDASSKFRQKLDCSNPYQECVNLLGECFNFFRNKPTKPSKLPLLIINQLKIVVDRHPSIASRNLNIDLKLEAIHIGLKLNKLGVLEGICQVFRLEENKRHVVDTVQGLLTQKKYIESCSILTATKLQNYFDLKDVAIPLFLQDKMNVVEIYLKDEPELQKQMVQFLDEIAGNPSKIETYIRELEVPSVRHGKFTPKTVSKLEARLLKLYNLPMDTCPNLSEIRSEGALKYVLYKRYIEKNLNEANWSDLVLETVGENKRLHSELLVHLCSYNDMDEAFKWAEILSVNKLHWPYALKHYKPNPSINSQCQASSSEVTKEECSDKQIVSPSEYLQFPLGVLGIHLVENTPDYVKAINDLYLNHDILSIDGEWKPCLGLHSSTGSPLALLQVSGRNIVYLFDTLALQKCLNESEKELLIDLLCNPRIRKLVFGFSSDLDKLADFVPKAKSKLKNTKNLLDLLKIYEKLKLCYPIFVETHSPTCSSANSKTLSEVTRTILGFPLNKSEQFSNWERRPLREEQMIYAALDAYCLIQVYDLWCGKALSLELNFDDVLKQCHLPFATISTEPKLIPSTKSKFETDNPPITVKEFRVVVDNMLQGLGRQLRLCGVDTVILESGDDHEKAAKLAQVEHRYILTAGQPYNMLKQHVPLGKCLSVPTEMNCQEQMEFVLRFYNVQIYKGDVLSRCTICNGDGYIYVTPELMKEMAKRFQDQNARGESLVSFPGGTINVKAVTLESGVPIRVEKLNQTIIERVSLFYICDCCGQVYWEGSHMNKVLEKFGPILRKQRMQSEVQKLQSQRSLEKDFNCTVSNTISGESDDEDWNKVDGLYYPK